MSQNAPSSSVASEVLAPQPTSKIYKQTINTTYDVEKTPKKKVIYPFWLGGAAAMTAATVSHPFDLIKVRLQTSKGAAKASALQTAINIIRTESFFGLYRGLSASLLRQATYSTMRFGTYEKVKLLLAKDGQELSFTKMVFAGAVGGAVGGVSGNSADIVMVRMQNDAKLEPHLRRNYRHAFDGLIRIGKEEGINGFFRGVGPNVNRAILMNVSQVTTYDVFKLSLLKTGYFKDNIWTHFSASLLSGLVATTICSPADVIKTRIMNSGSKPKSAFSILLTIIQQEGPFALFKGWVPAFARLGPHTIITFIVLEKMKELYIRKEIFGIKFSSQ
ncbi:1815_t:CDS:2 [Ambispora gerdemannii]|uniref:1815_t:CDS:1 n=1 Tax=Ambispora gerdemannii TaxID=144530 RepID=A0A9N8Z855_9GLOM|nr:1815_t:CDS:2 [Ambispora gerdemannii]